jgi:hypothetical protein
MFLALLCLILAVYVFYAFNAGYDPSLKTEDCKILERIETEDGIIEIVDEECQEGLPHTTNANTIRMTYKRYKGAGIKELLIHERVHLDQKRNPEKWKKFYKQHWDYDILLKSPLPGHLTKQLRPNPDTADSPWAVWRERYVFYPYLNDGTLKNAPVHVWDLEENKEVGIPEQWKARFCDPDKGCPHQYEHPHEMSAEFITLKSRSKAASQLFQAGLIKTGA